MKFGQSIKYNNINIFLLNSNKKWGIETSSRHLLFFIKALHEVKQVVWSLVSIYFDNPHYSIQLKQTA